MKDIEQKDHQESEKTVIQSQAEGHWTYILQSVKHAVEKSEKV